MKKIFSNTIILSVIFFFSCFIQCRECPVKKAEPMIYYPAMEEYFGMFKLGNWWKYSNQSGNKSDSVFINALDSTIQYDRSRKNCTTAISKQFLLRTNYMRPNFTEIFGQYVQSTTCCVNGFRLEYDTESIAVLYNPNVNVYPVPEEPTVGNSYDSILVNGKNYYWVLSFENTVIKLYFAPEIGIIRYISQSDTFNLINSNFQ